MHNPLSISELNNQIKALLETTFLNVFVSGEISNLTHHSSGHIYFSLKDENSTISCVMFKGNAQSLKFHLEVGQKVNIYASLTVYVPRGNYQLLAQKIEPSGIGELALAYEQLKEKLEKKGYFDKSIKKPLPSFPKKIVIITSNTGAAIEDMKKIAKHRWPLVKIILIPTLVQGVGAKEDIASSIKFADTLGADLLIVGRGGGSIEDLWAFNEEIVADAIFHSSTPIISAVGHESDVVISDFVADIRASTPSNAIEIALPDINGILQYLDDLRDDLNKNFELFIYGKKQELSHLMQLFKQNSFENKFNFLEENVKDLKNKFIHALNHIFNKKHQEIEFLQQSFLLNEPSKKIKKGFVQITKNNNIVSLDELSVGDFIFLEDAKYKIATKIFEIRNLV